MLNKVMLIGNVGQDPEVKQLDGGDHVATLSIATTERWKNKKGEKQEETQWHRCVAWRKTAEIIGEYVKKGDRIYVEGKLVHRSYDKDGETKYITEIVIRDMKMMGTKKDAKSEGSSSSDTPSPPPQAEKENESDAPF